MTGFGKKGLGSGAGMPRQSAGFGQAMPAQRMAQQHSEYDPMAAQREAFIAAERARREAEGGGYSNAYRDEPGHGSPGVSSYAQDYHSPHPRVIGNRSLAIAYIFWFILGQLSIHRFYLGATTSAIAQVGLLFGCFVVLFIFPPMGVVGLIGWALWIFADLFLMPGMHRAYCRQGAVNAGIFS